MRKKLASLSHAMQTANYATVPETIASLHCVFTAVMIRLLYGNEIVSCSISKRTGHFRIRNKIR